MKWSESWGESLLKTGEDHKWIGTHSFTLKPAEAVALQGLQWPKRIISASVKTNKTN